MKESKKQKIMEVLNVFETGQKDGDYGNISIFADGPNDMRQVTYGRSQTTEYGHLNELISDYAEADGEFSSELAAYVGRIGQKPSLQSNTKFKGLLKSAGDDPVMRKVQDEFFDRRYWKPAKKFFDDNGFEHPLSMLVVYDSYIHSGGIFSWLRKRFKATPKDEKAWVEQYVNTRHSWLAGHRRSVLRGTIYRTKAFKDLIKDDNWDLNKRFVAHYKVWEAEKEEEIPTHLPDMEIYLPEEKAITEYYDFNSGRHLKWFSFPIQMKIPSNELLVSRVGDERSDYVCHYSVRDRFQFALQEVYEYLGDKQFREEGWEMFGGGYDAGGNDAERYGLKFIFAPERAASKPIFNDGAVDIMEKYGFLNLGRATGKDFGTFVAYIPDIRKGDYYRKLGLPDNIG